MICTVDFLKQYVTTKETDQVLESKLQALELLIRKHTNNNFQQRNIRFSCPIKDGKLYVVSNFLTKGDTVQISNSEYSDGIYHITDIADGYIELNKALFNEPSVLVTRVEYPFDVVMGVVNMLKWDLENRDKVGISSETISRHSVTYFNMDGNNSSIGYPKSLIGFLQPHMKARF